MIYMVVDNMGTKKFTWTKKAALAWLPYCGSVAAVGNVLLGKVITYRIQK